MSLQAIWASILEVSTDATQIDAVYAHVDLTAFVYPLLFTGNLTYV